MQQFLLQHAEDAKRRLMPFDSGRDDRRRDGAIPVVDRQMLAVDGNRDDEGTDNRFRWLLLLRLLHHLRAAMALGVTGRRGARIGPRGQRPSHRLRPWREPAEL